MLPAKQKPAASRVIILKRFFIILNFDVFNVRCTGFANKAKSQAG